MTDGMGYVKQNGKIGYVNRAGQLVIPLQFEDAWSFHDGWASVKKDGKWGFIDKQGTYVIEPAFDQTGSMFLHGYCRVAKAVSYGMWGPILKWGYIDRTGKLVIDYLYSDASSFDENGIATVSEGRTRTRLKINTKGEIVK